MSETPNTDTKPSRRALPPPIALTERAADRVRELVARAPKPVMGLRVGVKARGCSGMSYVVEYAEERRKFEDVVESHGVKVFIDPTAVMYLLGSTLDYRDTKMESGFFFENPNEKGRCGCGESFTI
jgi:iron-sulfur cluster assembly protein